MRHSGGKNHRVLAISLALALAGPLFPPAHASEGDYPSGTLTLIVTFGAGGPNDALARAIASALSEQLKRTIVVENRGGGGGAIGLLATAKADPDGRTIALSGVGSVVQAPLMVKNFGVNPVTDLTAIGRIGNTTNTLVARPSFPAKTFADTLQMAREKPETITVGLFASGTKIGMAKIAAATGAKFIPVMFQSGAQGQTALMAGTIDLMYDATGRVKEQREAGVYHPLAVNGAQRSKAIPDVPTMAETIAGYDETGWLGLFGPKNMSPALVVRLNRELSIAVKKPAVQKIFNVFDMEHEPLSPGDFATLVRKTYDDNQKIVETLNLSQ